MEKSEKVVMVRTISDEFVMVILLCMGGRNLIFDEIYIRIYKDDDLSAEYNSRVLWNLLQKLVSEGYVDEDMNKFSLSKKGLRYLTEMSNQRFVEIIWQTCPALRM